MEDVVMGIIKEEAITEFTRDTPLDELGIDSLGWLAVRFDIAQAVEKQTGQEFAIPDEVAKQLKTQKVGDLLDYVQTAVKL